MLLIVFGLLGAPLRRRETGASLRFRERRDVAPLAAWSAELDLELVDHHPGDLVEPRLAEERHEMLSEIPGFVLVVRFSRVLDSEIALGEGREAHGSGRLGSHDPVAAAGVHELVDGPRRHGPPWTLVSAASFLGCLVLVDQLALERDRVALEVVSSVEVLAAAVPAAVSPDAHLPVRFATYGNCLDAHRRFLRGLPRSVHVSHCTKIARLNLQVPPIFWAPGT